MKPTQLMIDVAYEAALVTTAGELARNGGSVNYRVVIEAALTEALAIMPKVEESKSVTPEVAYSVFHTENGIEWGGLRGPFPKLSQALQTRGDSNDQYICKTDVNGETTPLYRWHVGNDKWQRFAP